nr:MAG TPA: hypothetical protein [Caudoviricetes sp.]
MSPDARDENIIKTSRLSTTIQYNSNIILY